MSKNVMFLMHGIGKNSKDWGEAIRKKLKDAANALPDGIHGFQRSKLDDAIAQTDFIELLYDDLMQQFLARMIERPEAFTAALGQMGLSSLAPMFTEDTSKASFLRDNIMDVVIYRIMPEHREAIRTALSLQIKTALQAYAAQGILETAKFSFLAHSLGTVVTHDTLQRMKLEADSPFKAGFAFENIFMLANTCALAANDYDPRTSKIRPFVNGNGGFTRMYFDFTHLCDPVARIFPYRKYMVNQEATGFEYVPHLSHFHEKNIHGFEHYLGNPQVHIRIFAHLYGTGVVPKDYFRAVLSGSVVPSGAPAIDETVKAELLALAGDLPQVAGGHPLDAIAALSPT